MTADFSFNCISTSTSGERCQVVFTAGWLNALGNQTVEGMAPAPTTREYKENSKFCQTIFEGIFPILRQQLLGLSCTRPAYCVQPEVMGKLQITIGHSHYFPPNHVSENWIISLRSFSLDKCHVNVFFKLANVVFFQDIAWYMRALHHIAELLGSSQRWKTSHGRWGQLPWWNAWTQQLTSQIAGTIR